jgi:hypothetical protein
LYTNIIDLHLIARPRPSLLMDLNKLKDFLSDPWQIFMNSTDLFSFVDRLMALRCIAGCEAHTNFVDESAFLTADNV